MAGESGVVAQITGQEDDRVLVSLPLVGFPPGFKLRRGDKVVVVHDENGPAVRPLVHPVDLGNAAPQESAGTLSAAGKRFEVPATIVRDNTGKGGYVAFVVDREGEGSEQVVAIRRKNA